MILRKETGYFGYTGRESPFKKCLLNIVRSLGYFLLLEQNFEEVSSRSVPIWKKVKLPRQSLETGHY